MNNDTLKRGLQDLDKTQTEIKQQIDGFFRSGGYQNQMTLIASALQEIVNKGSGEDTASLDNEFEYTNRYIRESVYELTELQKFLTNLRETYLRYRKCSDFLNQHTQTKQTTVTMHKQTN